MEKQNYSESIEMAKDHLTCVICMENPTEPLLLKCCGRICCKKCLEKWVNEKHTCPYCRSNIIGGIHEYSISIPWAENLATILGLYSNNGDEQFICKVHMKSVEYECENCGKLLCADCLFDMMMNPANSAHKDHKITKLSDKFLDMKKKIQALLPGLLDKLNTIQTYAIRLREYSTSLAMCKDDCTAQLYDEFNGTMDQVKRQFEEKVNALEELSQKVIYEKLTALKKKALSQLENQKEDPNTEDPSEDKAEDLKNTAKMLSAICSDYETKVNNYRNITVDNPLIPDYHTIKIIVPRFEEYVEEFSKMKENDPRYLYSQAHYICGNKWRAKIYPNGNSNGLNTHLSLFVELLKGPEMPERFQYKIEIMPAKKGIYPQLKSYASEFVQNDSWGWNKVAPLSMIRTPDYIQEDGSLLLYLSIRATSRSQEANDILAQIGKIKEKEKDLLDILSPPDQEEVDLSSTE